MFGRTILEDTMRIIKLGTCLVAASISLGGATFLAQPAQATAPMAPCSSADKTFADGYAAGYCAGQGYSSGTIDSCTDNGDGTISITGTCSM